MVPASKGPVPACLRGSWGRSSSGSQLACAPREEVVRSSFGPGQILALVKAVGANRGCSSRTIGPRGSVRQRIVLSVLACNCNSDSKRRCSLSVRHF